MTNSPPGAKATKPVVLVPHPDDVEDVRAGADAADRNEALSHEESMAYVRRLLGEDARGG